MLEKTCGWWLIWYLLFFCHGGAEVQLEWIVKEKVTAYGQNLILFCPVENCCSEPAGWSVGTKSIIIDVKTFSNDPKVKYHGTYTKDGFGVVIRNLSKADLNVTYRCVYGFDQSTPKYLLHGDVFREIQLQWVVKEKVTAYGQNLILFCPVENCCSEPAGWSVGPKTIIIDVKTFSNDPKVKFHGTYTQDGFGVVIRNLSEADLNVTYRCVYGFDQSTPKQLLHGDVFRENVPDKEKENDTTATVIVVAIVVIIVGLTIGICCVYRSRIKKKQTGTNEEKEDLNPSDIQMKYQQGTNEETENTNDSYIQMENQQDDIEVDISDNWETYEEEINSRSNTLGLKLHMNTEILDTKQKMQSIMCVFMKKLLGSSGKFNIELISARSEPGIMAQSSAQVEPVSGTSGLGPTTFQQDQSAKMKPMKSNNENEQIVSTIPQESYESAQQSAHVEPVSGTSRMGPTTFQQDQSAQKNPMKSNKEKEGDVSTITQESDESAQPSAQVKPVSGTSGVGPTTFQQDQSAKKKPMKSNNANEGDVSTIPQESVESDNPFPVHTINQGMTNYVQLNLVVTDIFPKLLREIMHSNITPDVLYRLTRKKHKNNPSVFDKMTHEERVSLNTMTTNRTYDNFSFITLYKLIRMLPRFDDPTQGWGNTPTNADVTISDDVERLRYIRNNIVHRIKPDIDMIERRDYLSNIVNITQRIDTYLGKLTGQGFAREVLNFQTHCMDSEMEQKYYLALKNIEDMKEQFSAENVHFYYGKTFTNLIQDVQSKLAKKSVTTISLVLEDINDDNKRRILNELKTEINSGLVNIKFKQAVSG